MTTGHSVDVSVIIAAWNAEAFIGAAVRSALDQRGLSVEVIVADDASTDATLDAARHAAAGNARLVCLRLDQNAGPSGARNRALEVASGRFIAVLDADDAMAPDRLVGLVAKAEAGPFDIVVDNMTRVDPTSAERRPFLCGPRASEEADITLEDYLDPGYANALGGPPGFLKPLIRMSAIGRTGQRYDLNLRNSEDHYFVASLLAGGASMVFTPSACYFYTVREGSLSHRLTPERAARIVEAEQAFQDRFQDMMTEAARRLSQQRLRGLRDVYALESAVDAMKRKNPAKLFSALANSTGSLPYVIGRLSMIAIAKLSGRADPAQR